MHADGMRLNEMSGHVISYGSTVLYTLGWDFSGRSVERECAGPWHAPDGSKYPPAKPGALELWPLKAAGGVANAAPGLGGH
jgi:hypothetical protein